MLGFYMGFIIDLLKNSNEFIDRSLADGYVLGLAFVCLLLAVLHVYHLFQVRRQKNRYLREMLGLEDELQAVFKDRTLCRLESQILREFVSQTELKKSLNLLLRRFVPNPQQGMAAFVEFRPRGHFVTQSRGLSQESQQSLYLDRELIDQVARNGVMLVVPSKLRQSQLLSSLTHTDRGKVRQLILVALGAPEEMSDAVCGVSGFREGESPDLSSQNLPCPPSGDLVGVFLTTALYPSRASLEQQMELAKRLMASVGGNLKRAQALEVQEHELRSASEILKLRSITDRHYSTPLKMIEEFLTSLAGKVGSDRVTLYLTTQNAGTLHTALVRCGTAMPLGAQSRWQQHEDLLADASYPDKHLQTFDQPRLLHHGIDSLIGGALVAPLIRNDSAIGILCLTKRGREPFDPSQRELAAWAADYLAKTLLRVLNHTIVERRAREDALTELANRREFDQRIVEELQRSEQSGTQCSLLLMDLDHFKSVNDTYGHQAGDEVLRVTAKILREQVLQIRSGDRVLIARYGGEEMAVLLPGISVLGAVRIGESIRAAVEAAGIRHGQHELHVTSSVGVATYPDHSLTVSELIGAADAALYQAKESGRNQVVCASAALVGDDWKQSPGEIVSQE
jgi:diguanylate cyclase (GGDEF)-like protein